MLDKDPGVTPNNGITFSANVTMNLLDPGTEAGTSGLITMPELKDTPDQIDDTFKAGITGSLNIPGLRLSPVVNGTNSLGTLRLSFDPANGNTADGSGGGKMSTSPA